MIFRLPRLFLFLIIQLSALSQFNARILYEGPLLDGPDGMLLSGQKLMITNWGKKGDGNTLVRFDLTSNKIELLYDRLQSPDGIAQSKKGDLFISNYKTGQILVRSIKDTSFRILSVINGRPAGLAVSKDQKFLFVADFGNFNGSKIYKITLKNGLTEIFADSLEVPLGIALRGKNIFVSTFKGDKLYNLRNRKKIIIGTTVKKSARLQFIAFYKKSLLIPSYSHNCIYRFKTNGTIEILDIRSSNGEPYIPSGPNSICTDKKGNIYFTEFNSGRLVKLTPA